MHNISYNFGKGTTFLSCSDRKQSISFLFSLFLNVTEKFENLEVSILGTAEPFDGYILNKSEQGYMFTVVSEADVESNVQGFPEGFWAMSDGSDHGILDVPNAYGFKVPRSCFFEYSTLKHTIMKLYGWANDYDGGEEPVFEKGSWYEWSFGLGFGDEALET